MADIIHVTPQYLCILFKQLMDKRPFEYINEVRITKSKEWILSDYSLSLSSISQKVGFENPSYFGATFKKLQGITPGQFKELYIMNNLKIIN